MSEFQYKNGLGNVGSYQVSGIPFASSSIACPSDEMIEINFPKVTKFVTIRCDSGSLAVGFSENGLEGDNYFVLSANESYGGEWRIVRLYLQGNDIDAAATVIAGMANIDADQLSENWSGTLGVG